MLHLKYVDPRFQALFLAGSVALAQDLALSLRQGVVRDGLTNPKSIMILVRRAEVFIHHCRAHQYVLVALTAWECAAYKSLQWMERTAGYARPLFDPLVWSQREGALSPFPQAATCPSIEMHAKIKKARVFNALILVGCLQCAHAQHCEHHLTTDALVGTSWKNEKISPSSCGKP